MSTYADPKRESARRRREIARVMRRIASTPGHPQAARAARVVESLERGGGRP